MTANEPADPHEPEIIRWLQAQRDALAPTVLIRDQQGRVVVRLPPKDRDEIDELLADMRDDTADD
jgi:hypothetical protein